MSSSNGVYIPDEDVVFQSDYSEQEMITTTVGMWEVVRLRELLDIPFDRRYTVWEVIELAADKLERIT